MNHPMLPDLVDQLRTGRLSRREFMQGASALGVSTAAAAMLARHAAAQEGSPAASPSETGKVTRSVSREEFNATLREKFQFDEPAVTGGQLIVTQTNDISTLNPTLVDDTYSSWISSFLFDALVGGSPVDGTVVPGLADYWEVAADGVTHTFYLNKDAKFHDGTPVTADDVIFTFDGVLAEDSLSVRKASVEDYLKEYKKVDDHTVQLIGKAPAAEFVRNAAGQFGIMPKHIWEGVKPSDWGSDPGSTGQDPARVVGSGPFKFVEWQIGDHVTLTKNADYWDKQNTPIIDEYIYRVIADASSAIASLQTGESDVTEIAPTQANPLRESNPELQIIDYDTYNFNYYTANEDPSRSELFTEVPVRQALHYALDRDIIVQTSYQGYAIRADGTQPVLSIAYAPDKIRTIYTYDPDKAKSLLDEAGWVDSDGDGIRDKNGVKFSFECMFSEGVARYETQIPYMQQAWREVGIEMIPTAVPFPTLSDSTEAGTYDMAVWGFSWTPDPSQGDMFRCNATPPNGFNHTRYCNENYDKLDEQARVELDQQKRIDLVIEASNIVNDEMAAGLIVFSKSIYGAAPRVHNFLPNGYGEMWWVPYAWVEQ